VFEQADVADVLPQGFRSRMGDSPTLQAAMDATEFLKVSAKDANRLPCGCATLGVGGAGKNMQHILLVAVVPDERFLRDLRWEVASQDDMHLLAELRDTANMLRIVENLHPDVLLLHEPLAGVSSRADSILSDIHRACPATRTLLVSDNGSDRCGERALQYGVRGCIRSNASAGEWLRAIRAVSRGEVWIGRKEISAVLDVLLTQLERANEVSDRKFAELLSARELQIVGAVRLGLTNKEIARKLRISPTTVKTHLENIFHKLKVTHRVQLAMLAGAAPVKTARS